MKHAWECPKEWTRECTREWAKSPIQWVCTCSSFLVLNTDFDGWRTESVSSPLQLPALTGWILSCQFTAESYQFPAGRRFPTVPGSWAPRDNKVIWRCFFSRPVLCGWRSTVNWWVCWNISLTYSFDAKPEGSYESSADTDWVMAGSKNSKYTFSFKYVFTLLIATKFQHSWKLQC